MELIRSQIEHYPFKVNAFSLLPDKLHPSSSIAIFTHGYTTHKGDVLPWAARLVEAGIPTLIFDLPGHYLGSFEDVTSFDDFKDKAHHLFEAAFDVLKNQLLINIPNFQVKKLILGGHSLGSLLSLKALTLTSLPDDKISVAVGIGLNLSPHTHLFETSFYQKALKLRRQLVSPAIDSDVIFPWIKEEKRKLNIGSNRAHLITGIDDVVVGTGGTEAFAEILRKGGATITVEEPTKLPHHEPGLAASHLYAFLRNNFL